MASRRWLTLTGAALVLGLAAAGCSAPDGGTVGSGSPEATVSTAAATSDSAAPGESTPAESETTSAKAPEEIGEPGAAAGTAAAALASLEVKGRAPMTGYDREQFGPAWADTDHNGCDTRNDMLARDLTSVTFRPGTNDCVVLTGVLNDPYTATDITFLRGQGTSEAVHIDHVVALADAWQKGAQQLDAEVRRQFANDPLNLLAVDGPANMQKGAGDAATWLPANRSFRCDYVARQIAVKANYDLWVTAAERDAMARVLDACPGQVLPEGRTSPAVEPTATAPAPEPLADPAVEPAAVAPAPAPAPAAQPEGTDPQFSSCRKAKAAGYGPYVAGIDPEYHWYGDGDNDGINCE